MQAPQGDAPQVGDGGAPVTVPPEPIDPAVIRGEKRGHVEVAAAAMNAEGELKRARDCSTKQGAPDHVPSDKSGAVEGPAVVSGLPQPPAPATYTGGPGLLQAPPMYHPNAGMGGGSVPSYSAGPVAGPVGGAAPQPIPPVVQGKINELIAAGQLKHEDVDENIRTSLGSMSEEKGLEAIEKFLEAHSREPIQNKRAFLGGIVRRLRDHSGAGGGGDPDQFAAALARMPMSCQAKVQQMFTAGQLLPGDLEPKVLMDLIEFGEAGATICLDRFAGSNMSTVRSKTAFMFGIIKRYRNELKSNGGAAGGYGAGAYGAGGMGAYPAASGAYGAYGNQHAYNQYAQQQWAQYYQYAAQYSQYGGPAQHGPPPR